MKYLEHNAERSKLVAQERLIFTATELVCDALEDRGVTRHELAQRIGVTPAEITQRLNGRRNLTLRSLAEMLDALGFDAEFDLQDRRDQWNRIPGHSPRTARAMPEDRGRYTRTGVRLHVTPSPAA